MGREREDDADARLAVELGQPPWADDAEILRRERQRAGVARAEEHRTQRRAPACEQGEPGHRQVHGAALGLAARVDGDDLLAAPRLAAERERLEVGAALEPARLDAVARLEQ